MAPPKILVMAGSLRPGSHNARLAALAAKELALAEADVTRISLADYPLPLFDADFAAGNLPHHAVQLRRMLEAHQGVFITSPEYSASVTPLLKNAIDWVSRMKDVPFKDKPVAIQSCAGGVLGGARMQYHLRQSLTSIDAHLFGKPEILVTFAAKKFDEKTLELTDQPTIDIVKQQLAGFEKFIRRLNGKT